MKTLVEIHVLQNFAPSNLNRDDTGAPKDAFFGGCRRARISSQCIKRSVREYFKSKNDKYFSVRTKRIVDELRDILVPQLSDHAKYSDDSLLEAIEKAINCIGTKDKKVKVEKDKKTDQLKTDVLLFLSRKEIDAFAGIIKDSFEELLQKTPPKEVVAQVRNTIAGKEDKSRMALDIALFGRMLAVMPDKNQYAACQVAHAISTHSVNREFDFFTALDDLKPDDAAGSDMMGDFEFTSACFYRYAVIDVEKMKENLDKSPEETIGGIKTFLEGFIISEPTGKQNATAAHNPPEFVAISVKNGGAPCNLSNAFEKPIKISKNESLTKESAVCLAEKAKALNTLYGNEGATCFVCAEDTFGKDFKLDEFGENKGNVQDLLKWVDGELCKKGE